VDFDGAQGTLLLQSLDFVVLIQVGSRIDIESRDPKELLRRALNDFENISG
jgi:hypothetical protein